jgi:integrase
MSSVSPKVTSPQERKRAGVVAPIPPATNAELLAIFRRALETGDNHVVATGADARRMQSELDEVRALRRKQVGGSVYKRKDSRFWQIEYPVCDGKWRQESARTENKRDADALLRSKVYRASAGTLPGTASFEQVIDALVDDARVRGNKAAARLAGAARALKARLAGYRAEACNYAVWLKYAADREREVSRDTVHLELGVAKRAYKLAHVNGLISRVPDFPAVRNLRVRQGFIDPAQWGQLRSKLRPDFRDAAEFAFLCGAREMETLTLKWDAVEPDARVIHLRETKNGKPRAIPYADYPELAAVIERRSLVHEQLKRGAVITPWVFCFSAPVAVRGRQYHAAGGQLFKTTGQGGLPACLRDEWAAACIGVGLPGLLFHDLRRSAARNFERAGIPRSVAMKLGGWTDKIYSRYAIGAENEIAAAVPKLSEYLKRAGLQFSDTELKNPIKSRKKLAEGGRSRTFRQAYCPPGRF